MQIKQIFFLLLFFTVTTQLTAQTEPNRGNWVVSTRLGMTLTQPDSPDLEARSATRTAYGLAVIWDQPLGARIRFGVGLGLDFLGLRTEVDDVLPPIARLGDLPRPVTLEARANLYYLSVPLQLKWYPLAAKDQFFVTLRSDLSVPMGGKSLLLEYTAGDAPFGLSTPRRTVFEQPDIAHFLSLGLGYRLDFGGSLRTLSFQPYARMSTVDVLKNPGRLETNNRRDYLRETGLLEFGLGLELAF